MELSTTEKIALVSAIQHYLTTAIPRLDPQAVLDVAHEGGIQRYIELSHNVLTLDRLSTRLMS